MATRDKSSATAEVVVERAKYEPRVPVPEHLRVDIGSAVAEFVKGFEPEAPEPIFSTRALDHGLEAAGARHRKPGFGYNEQMDLLWGLGFPEVGFIVDGAPAVDSKDELLWLYNQASARPVKSREELRGDLPCGTYFGRWFDGFPLRYIQTRRGATQLVVEKSTPVESTLCPRSLPEEEYLRVTEPRELTQDELERAYPRLAASMVFDYRPLVIEALCGPDRAMDAALTALERRDAERPRCYWDLLLPLLPMGWRLREAELERARRRLADWVRADDDVSVRECVRFFVDPEKTARELVAELGKMSLFRVYHFTWPEQVTREAPIPAIPRAVFNGDSDRLLARSAEYNPSGREELHTFGFSACRSAHILPPLLRVGTSKDYKHLVQAWLRGRGKEHRAGLEQLAGGADAKLGRLAKQALKVVDA